METLKELSDSLRNRGYNAIRTLIVEQMQPVFDLGLKAFCWEQYAPGWNDGDACEFGLHDPMIPTVNDERPMYFDNLSYYLEKGDPSLAIAGITSDNSHEIQGLVYKIFRPFREFQDMFQFIFGDSVRVTVYADGKIEVDEYEWQM